LLDKITGGVMAGVMGDALGVSVEFMDRAVLEKNPVTGYREYGTHHQPKGTWSDDSSMLLCTMESMLGGIDYGDMMDRFMKWYREGYWTATGEVFDIGNTTRSALRNRSEGRAPLECGPSDERSNGNGSLMRILPVALAVHAMEGDRRREIVFNASALTHGHIRSRIACWLYAEMIRNLLLGLSREESVDRAARITGKWCRDNGQGSEWKHFESCTTDIKAKKPVEIKSSGYVIHSLEAALYSFLTTGSVIESLLIAVNLGEDTDTTAAVTGGLSGVHYGFESIPRDWVTPVLRRDDILKLCGEFAKAPYFG
jgi:ADP-ribosyl-[dinitrogen reductase] hydrolase